MDPRRTDVLLKKVHSLTGVLPIGIFLVAHLATSSTVLDGRVAWTERALRIQSISGALFIEWAAILLPLGVHVLLGLWLASRGRSDDAALGSVPAWSSVAQRVTGICALAFIALHLWEYRVQRSLGTIATSEMYDRLASSLEGRLLFVPYLVGISATVFHFANGLWRFSVSRGVARTAVARRSLGLALGIGGVLIWMCWLDVLAHFHAGGPLLGWLGGSTE